MYAALVDMLVCLLSGKRLSENQRLAARGGQNPLLTRPALLRWKLEKLR